jgi:hypothetical protein
MVHARVRFHQPVIGPVLAGSMRYLGLGLFLPASRRSSWHLKNPPAAGQAVLTGPAETEGRKPAEVSS